MSGSKCFILVFFFWIPSLLFKILQQRPRKTKNQVSVALSKLCTVQILPDNDSLKSLLVQLQSIYPILKPIPCANDGLSRFDNTTLFQLGHCDVIKGDMAA